MFGVMGLVGFAAWVRKGGVGLCNIELGPLIYMCVFSKGPGLIIR